jgi:hypothetical protein
MGVLPRAFETMRLLAGKVFNPTLDLHSEFDRNVNYNLDR